jgi:hypothetical protein
MSAAGVVIDDQRASCPAPGCRLGTQKMSCPVAVLM